MSQELQIAGINFKAFDLGGHEIARRVWKDYYASVRPLLYHLPVLWKFLPPQCEPKASSKNDCEIGNISRTGLYVMIGE